MSRAFARANTFSADSPPFSEAPTFFFFFAFVSPSRYTSSIRSHGSRRRLNCEFRDNYAPRDAIPARRAIPKCIPGAGGAGEGAIVRRIRADRK